MKPILYYRDGAKTYHVKPCETMMIGVSNDMFSYHQITRHFAWIHNLMPCPTCRPPIIAKKENN